MSYIIIIAYVLDILFGDPYWFPHPVKIIGRGVSLFERILRKSALNLKISGFFLVLITVNLTYLSISFLLFLSGSLHLVIGNIVSCFFIYTCFSIKSLGLEAKKIYTLLKCNDLSEARNALSLIVGRDTQHLSEVEIIRATVETVAENTVDGVLAPLFYACLGGAQLALAYKAVNTLDSMVGYRNERYKDFGWFSAKFDDFANWIPARISGIIIPVAAFLLSMRFKQAVNIIIRDSRKSLSPNAGIAEAGFAGAMGIVLGGANYYGEKLYEKPVIGISSKEKDINDILKSIRLMQAVSLISVLCAVGLFILKSNRFAIL
ncbi:MAG: cobalamin biosynthesis protein CobD [Candidatus Omnitrophota bacterium]|nr:MAG: cobalamin biosynthesis protein CobD [Candidatus Omnitrophota bacterium]